MRTESSAYNVIEYPDEWVYSGNSNVMVCTPQDTGRHIKVTFTINSANYEEVFFPNSAGKVQLDLSYYMNLFFTTNKTTTFTTAINININILTIITATSATEETKSLNFYLIYGKQKVFDVFGDKIESDVYDEDTGLYFFYLNEAKEYFISYDSGQNFTSMGTLPKGISSINLSSYFPATIIILDTEPTSVFDETFDYTFKTINGVKAIIRPRECLRNEIKLRYLNRFGLFKYKVGMLAEQSHENKTLIEKRFEDKSNTLSDVFYKESVQKKHSLNIFFGSQNRDEQNKFIDLIESEFVCMFNNGKWLPVKTTTKEFATKEYRDVKEDLMLNVEIQNEF